MNIVQAVFGKPKEVRYFSVPGGLKIKKGEVVVAETWRGLDLAKVLKVMEGAECEGISVEGCIKRKADDSDVRLFFSKIPKEREAFEIAKKKVREHNLHMKLVDAEYTLDKKRLLFYFLADGRVDFRELVKDLASIFKLRIEMRQIGDRDETKIVGGIGPCGRPLCCSSFLYIFKKISVRMAKEQNLSLNPNKISGLCGKLMCCLAYEYDTYKEAWSKLPKVNQRVHTPKGEGVVVSVEPLKEQVAVAIDDREIVFSYEEVTTI